MPLFYRRKLKNQSYYQWLEVTRWQRQAMGLRAYEARSPGRPFPKAHRFNPGAAHLTRGTTGEAWKWMYYDQTHLPNVPPASYREPVPHGRAAWPPAWTQEFAEQILVLTDEDIREHILTKLTTVIHNATQEDGYELRRLDFEGKPMTELPERSIIETFVFEEETLRDRIISEVVEDEFRFTPNSTQRAEMRDTENVIRYVIAKLRTCRDPESYSVTDAVKQFLNKQPIQPEFGFEHGLPIDDRPQLNQEWERMFHHDWQFGNAVYKPRSEERTHGNPEWMRLEQEWKDREEFEKHVQSGEAKRRHEELIRLAAK